MWQRSLKERARRPFSWSPSYSSLPRPFEKGTQLRYLHGTLTTHWLTMVSAAALPLPFAEFAFLEAHFQVPARVPPGGALRKNLDVHRPSSD